MLPGSGIMALVDFLNLPEIYQSYGDTNVDRLTNPDLYKDAARVPANAFLDSMTFLGDLATDIPAVATDYVQAIRDGEDLTLLSDQGRDLAAATISGFTGLPSLTTDNPMVDTSLTQDLLADTQRTIDSKYEPEFQKIANEAYNYVDNTMPAFATFAVNNPNKTIADYQAMEDQMFTQTFDDMFNKNLASQYEQDYNNLRSQSSVNKFGYDIFDQDIMGRDLMGPGFRKFTLGDVSGTDIPLKYASEGEYFLPFMEYEGPDKENLERLTFMTEIGAGVPALIRGVGKRFMRNRDAVNPDLDDAINEYMRD
tara:strand:+ start:43 stop:972 length:930 start_codon:yes stop_codon:yes gene_type:complete